MSTSSPNVPGISNALSTPTGQGKQEGRASLHPLENTAMQVCSSRECLILHPNHCLGQGCQFRASRLPSDRRKEGWLSQGTPSEGNRSSDTLARSYLQECMLPFWGLAQDISRRLPALVQPSGCSPLLMGQAGSDALTERSLRAMQRLFWAPGWSVEGVGVQVELFSVPSVAVRDTERSGKHV